MSPFHIHTNVWFTRLIYSVKFNHSKYLRRYMTYVLILRFKIHQTNTSSNNWVVHQEQSKTRRKTKISFKDVVRKLFLFNVSFLCPSNNFDLCGLLILKGIHSLKFRCFIAFSFQLTVIVRIFSERPSYLTIIVRWRIQICRIYFLFSYLFFFYFYQ